MRWLDLSPSVSLYHGDCRVGVESLGHRTFDAIITDPPYGISHPCNFAERGRGGFARCNDWPDVSGDQEPFNPEWVLDLDVPTVLWGANHYADKLPPSGGWLVWDKERPDSLDQSTCELAWTNCVKGVRRFRHLWNGAHKDSERGESYHATQKPVALMSWVLSLKWLEGVSSVFDPYMGAGPVGVACSRLGLGYIGCEVEELYFDTATKRVGAEVAQGKLFA